MQRGRIKSPTLTPTLLSAVIPQGRSASSISLAPFHAHSFNALASCKLTSDALPHLEADGLDKAVGQHKASEGYSTVIRWLRASTVREPCILAAGSACLLYVFARGRGSFRALRTIKQRLRPRHRREDAARRLKRFRLACNAA